MSSTRSNTSHSGDSNRRLSSLVAVVALVCCAASALAIDPSRTLSQYVHDTWGTERGFPSGTVSSIAQTPDGYLWIGTDKGLARFDGLSFRRFDRARPASLAIGPVRKLLTDKQGNLWILLQNTKLLRYRDGNFTLVPGEAENGITAMSQGAGNKVLLSSLAVGVLTADGENFTAASESLASGQSRNEAPTTFSWSTGLAPHRLMEPTAAVISLAETTDGKIWLGTEDRGLYYLQQGRVSAAAAAIPNLRINCFLPLSNSDLWVATNKGVMHWDGKELTRAGIPPELPDLEVLSMIRDRDSNIWVGTTRGLFRVNEEGVASFAQGVPSAATPVKALFEDREGNLWIGGVQRLELLRDSPFVTYLIPALQSAGALYVDSEDYTWIAPLEGGLWWLKGSKYAPVTVAGLAHDVAYSIASTRTDSLWIGRQEGGLTHLQSIHGAMTSTTYTKANGLAQNSVYAVLEARDGTIWSGTLTAGVSALKNGRFTNYTTKDGLASNTVSSIAEGADATLWFGTPNGLSAMSKSGWRTYGVSDGLPSEDINCLLQDSGGVLWIGTVEGLAFLQGGQLHVFNGEPESLREPILGIEEDTNGWLWISTADRVLQVKRSSNETLSGSAIRQFGVADGLYGTEGVRRFKSVVEDSHGRIWFSTNHGVSVVNPERERMNRAPAIVQIEAVLANGSPFDLRGSIRVPAGQEKITFRFIGLSLADAERVRYRYRLDGLDKGWSEPEETREAAFDNLSAGNYRFRVVASNSDGIWNGSEASVGFNIEPKLWQTWWFRLTLVAGIALVTILIYRLRMQQVVRLLSVRFEERLSERTRIAQELHDTLLQGLFSAGMQLDVANDRLPTDSPAKPIVERVIELIHLVGEQGRSAILRLRSDDPQADDLEQALSRICEEVPGGNQVDFSVVVEGTPRPLRQGIWDEAYRIGREAAINAFRHASAKKIEIEIEYSRSGLRMLVRDDGRGIDAHVLQTGREGHWGLAGMRERAERVGANLQVLSRTGAGTEVELSVPGNVAFETTSSRRWPKWLSGLFHRKHVERPSDNQSAV